MTNSCREWFLQQRFASRGHLDSVLESVRYCFEHDSFHQTTLFALIKDVYERDSFQILKILRGESENETKTKTESFLMEDSQSVENGDDEVYPNSSSELHLSLALVGVDDDDDDGDYSFSSVEQRKRVCLEDYFKARCSRSSSFNQLL